MNLLRYADEQEAKTGDPGADFRSEAYTYIAGSLTYVDFDGPPSEHPFVVRNDVLDTEPNPVEAERKMGVAITRVQDPELIPQDQEAERRDLQGARAGVHRDHAEPVTLIATPRAHAPEVPEPIATRR